jgi:hypothetical protein
MNRVSLQPSLVTVLVIIAIGLLACGHGTPQTNTPSPSATATSPGGARRPISLISIVADPSKYHGRELEVMAFFSFNETHGQYILAPDLDSIGQDLTANCVYLDVSQCAEKLKLENVGNPALCILRGTVDTNHVGFADYPMFPCGFHATKCVLSVRLRPRQ